MRIFVGGLYHEASVFSPIATTRESFTGWGDGERPTLQAHEAAQLVFGYGDLIAAAASAGHEVIQGAYFEAEPSAPPDASTFLFLCDRVVQSCERAMRAGKVDAVLLFQHGAQVAEGIDDCESVLLARLREIIGSDRICIGTLLDLHGNTTREMLRYADIILACREFPHSDFADRAAELVYLVTATARGAIEPHMQLWQLPMSGLLPTDGARARELLSMMQDTEQVAGVLSVSLFHGFVWSDHPDATGSLLVVTDGLQGDQWSLVRPLAQLFAAACEEFLEQHPLIDAKAAIALALETPPGPGPVVIADRGDNPGGGGPGDATWLLQELVRKGIYGAGLALLYDPEAVQKAHQLGEGANAEFKLAGRERLSGPPVAALMQVVACRSDVRQQVCGTAYWQALGRSALLRLNNIDIIVNDRRQGVFSRHVFSGHGVDVQAYPILVVKSTSHFRADFSQFSRRVIDCDPPGATTEDLRAYHFSRLRRPLWPLDQMPIADRSTPRRIL